MRKDSIVRRPHSLRGLVCCWAGFLVIVVAGNRRLRKKCRSRGRGRHAHAGEEPIPQPRPGSGLCRRSGLRGLPRRPGRFVRPASHGPFHDACEQRLSRRLGRSLRSGSFHYEVEHRNGKLIHREVRKDAKGQALDVEEAEISHVLGSGTRGYAFLAEREGGLYQSPIAWYTKRETWDLSPGYRAENRHFDREVTLDCLFCHTNRTELTQQGSLAIREPTIGCERCHGPGGIHVQEQRVVNGTDLTIVESGEAGLLHPS